MSVGLLLADMSVLHSGLFVPTLKDPEPRNLSVIVFRYLSREVLQTLAAVSGVLLLIIMSGRFISYLSIAAAGEIPMEAVFYYLLFRLHDATAKGFRVVYFFILKITLYHIAISNPTSKKWERSQNFALFVFKLSKTYEGTIFFEIKLQNKIRMTNEMKRGKKISFEFTNQGVLNSNRNDYLAHIIKCNYFNGVVAGRQQLVP